MQHYLCSAFKKLNIPEAEIDFIYLHPAFGVFIIEVKSSKRNKESAKRQVERDENILNKILRAASGRENVDEYFAGKAIYIPDRRQMKTLKYTQYAKKGG
jgi:hypothetical protein